jgi:protein-disulfide isomerase
MIDELNPAEPIQENHRSQWKLWLAAGGCVVLLCGMAFIGILIISGPKLVQQIIPQKIQAAQSTPRAFTQNNFMGDPAAPVQIIEYGDFQCPYCLKFWTEAEPQMIKEYVNTGKVYFEYRSVGAFIGTESAWAAEGAYCAGDQGKFWEYHNTLFTNWSGENAGDFTKDKLVKYARALNLNMDEFQSCINEEKHKVTVEQDSIDAHAAGVQATPTFFINGIRIEGAQPYALLKQVIEKALNGNLNKLSG